MTKTEMTKTENSIKKGMNNSKMNILHVIHRYWPAVGGSEKYFQEISERLSRGGHKVSVYTTDAWDSDYLLKKGKKRINKSTDIHNGVYIRRFRVWHPPKYTSIKHVLFNIPSYASKSVFTQASPLVPALFRSLLREGQYNLVHVTALPFDSLIYFSHLFAQKNKIPFVFTPFLHFEESGNGGNGKGQNQHQFDLMARADAVLVQTDREFRYLENNGVPSEILCRLGMGINPEEMAGGSAQRFRKKHGIFNPIVFHVCTKTLDKGSHHLVEAMKKLWSDGLDATLVLAGPPLDDFTDYFSSQPEDVKRRCLLLDLVEGEEKLDLFAAGDVYAMPSRADAFGIVYLESWFYEKPVIGAEIGGVPDVIRHGKDGLLVPFGNVDNLADSIKLILSNKKLAKKFGQTGRQRVLSELTWDKKFAIIENLYHQLLQEFPARQKVDKSHPLKVLVEQSFVAKHIGNVYQRRFPDWTIDNALRYLPVIDHIKACKIGKPTILEVGSGSKGITVYLPKKVTGVDIEFNEKPSQLMQRVRASGTYLPFSNQKFDFVISVDMLEHLNEPERKVAIQEVMRVAKNRVFIGVPMGPEATVFDMRLAQLWRERFGEDHNWLKEHIEKGLPTHEDVEEWILEAAQSINVPVRIKSLKNVNLSLWYLLRRMNMSGSKILSSIEHRGLLFALPVLKHMNYGKCYRQIFIVDILTNQHRIQEAFIDADMPSTPTWQ